MKVIHSLGVVLCVMTVAWCMVASTTERRRRRHGRRRLTAVLGVRTKPRPGARSARSRTVLRRWVPVAGAVCAGYVVLGGPLGLLAGLAGGWLCWRRQRRPGPEPDFDAARAARELPLAADLLAACIAAGAAPVEAAQAVGESMDGPVGTRLSSGAAQLRLGGGHTGAWQRLAMLPGARPLARLLERAGESGAPAAEAAARLAAETRAEWGRAATARARRAAVLVTAPVGLCFLPAFVALGVLPVVIGLAGGLLSGGG